MSSLDRDRSNTRNRGSAHCLIREGKHLPKDPCWIITEKSSILVASWGHQVSKTTIRHHLHPHYLEDMPEKSLSYHFTTNVSVWSSLNATKHQHLKLVWRKNKNAYAKNNLLSMVEVEVPWCCRADFLPKGLGNLLGYMASWTPWNTRTLFNLNLTAPARKLKLHRHWIFQQDNDPQHASNSTQKELTEYKIRLLPWSPQSPDLNLWAELKRRVHKRGPGWSEKIL